MPEALLGGYPVAHELFELFDVRESALRRAGPDQLIIHAHLEDTTVAGSEGYFSQLLLEGREQLLRHPRPPQQPAALRAIGDEDARFGHTTQRNANYLAMVGRRSLRSLVQPYKY
jgi:hypothetical protein